MITKAKPVALQSATKVKLQPKIFWKEDEKRAIALKATELFLTPAYSKSWISAIHAAQELILPANRQRKKNSIQVSTAQNALLKALGKKLYEQKMAAEKLAKETPVQVQEKEVSVEPPVEEMPQPSVMSAVDELILNQTADFDEVAAYCGTQYDVMINSFVNLIGETFKNALTAKLNTVFNEVLDSVQHQVGQKFSTITKQNTQKVQKPKMVVVGLLPDQGNEIEKHFGEYFTFVFIETDKAQSQLKHAAASAVKVVLNTKHISHSIQETVRRHPGLILAHGVSKVEEAILELACQK